MCQPLGCECDAGCECWPKRVRGNVPWQPNSRRLKIWEGDRLVHEEDIPAPPELKIAETQSQADGLLLKWSAVRHAKKDSTEALWYIVHWFDDEDGVWRGVAPRQQETSMVVPKTLFVRSMLKVRILGTSGIATGYAEEVITLDDHAPSGATVHLLGHDPHAAGPQRMARPVLHAVAFGPNGRQAPSDSIIWYDSSGAELGRGSHLDVRSLPAGRRVVRAVFRQPSGRYQSKDWLIEHHAAAVTVHHESPQPKSGTRPEHRHPHAK